VAVVGAGKVSIALVAGPATTPNQPKDKKKKEKKKKQQDEPSAEDHQTT